MPLRATRRDFCPLCRTLLSLFRTAYSAKTSFLGQLYSFFVCTHHSSFDVTSIISGGWRFARRGFSSARFCMTIFAIPRPSRILLDQIRSFLFSKVLIVPAMSSGIRYASSSNIAKMTVFLLKQLPIVKFILAFVWTKELERSFSSSLVWTLENEKSC